MKKRTRMLTKADVILVAVVFAAAAVLLFALYGPSSSEGAYVQVTVDGEVAALLPIDTNDTLIISSAGGGSNTLVIQDGYAKMTEADCPDGICVSHKKINKTGESIICLPHKVVVTVIGSDTDEIDGVA